MEKAQHLIIINTTDLLSRLSSLFLNPLQERKNSLPYGSGYGVFVRAMRFLVGLLSFFRSALLKSALHSTLWWFHWLYPASWFSLPMSVVRGPAVQPDYRHLSLVGMRKRVVWMWLFLITGSLIFQPPQLASIVEQLQPLVYAGSHSDHVSAKMLFALVPVFCIKCCANAFVASQ